MQTARGRRGLLLNHACSSYEYMACLQKPGRGELLPRAHFVKTIDALLGEGRGAKNEKSITISTPTPTCMYGENLCIFIDQGLS